MRLSNIRNFSIFAETIAGRRWLFSYFEYTGTDYEADMKALAEDPETQRWWRETNPCQRRLPDCPPGAQWSPMEMVFPAHPVEG